MSQTNVSLRHIAVAVTLLLLTACASAPPQRVQEAVFYPPLPQQPRIQYLTTLSTQDDLGETTGLRRFLTGEERSRNRLMRPYAIAHEKDFLYVSDARYKKIVILDLKNATMAFFPDRRMGTLVEPMGIFIDADGSRYVADRGRGQVIVYDAQNEYLRTYGAPGEYQVTDVVVDGGRVYVCENQTHEIVVLDKASGEVVQRIGGKGREEGQLHFPSHLSLDQDGNLFVTDILNFRVQMFDRRGAFVRAYGYPEAGPGGMVRPKDHAIARDGRMYLSDAGMEIVQIFDVESAAPLLAFGKYGTGPGSTDMPYGVHIDYDNVAHFARYVDPEFRPIFLIYVANHVGPNKLNVYAFGEWLGPR